MTTADERLLSVLAKRAITDRPCLHYRATDREDRALARDVWHPDEIADYGENPEIGGVRRLGDGSTRAAGRDLAPDRRHLDRGRWRVGDERAYVAAAIRGEVGWKIRDSVVQGGYDDR